MGNNTAFCINCGCKQNYIIKSHMDTLTVRNIEFSYMEKTAYCSECGKEVYVPEINDYNCEAREIAYSLKANNKTTK